MKLRILGAAALSVLALAACSKPEAPAQPLRTVPEPGSARCPSMFGIRPLSQRSSGRAPL